MAPYLRSWHKLFAYPLCVYTLLIVVPCPGHAQVRVAQKRDDKKGVVVEPIKGSRWAILIGVDDYAELTDLHYCGADMKSLRDQLINNGFLDDHVVLLNDHARESKYKPNKANIDRQLSLLLPNLEDADILLVAFSGHGVHISGTSYFCPTEARIDKPNTLISIDTLYESLRSAKGTLKLVMVDACRSDPEQPGQKNAISNSRQFGKSVATERLPPGLVLLNSCAAGEISWEEREFEHGVFMHFVIEGLRGSADADRDGNVTLNELSRYASEHTKAYVARRFNGAQHPFLRSDVSFDALDYELFHIAPNPGRISIDTKPTKQDSVQLEVISPAGMEILGKDAEGGFRRPSKSWTVPASIKLKPESRYRMKLRKIAGFEGRCLYPSLQVSSAPTSAGTLFSNNKIVLEFTEEEFDRVLRGETLKKVLYYPSADFIKEDRERRKNELGTSAWVSNFSLDPSVDPIAEASRRGDILAILEMGDVDLEYGSHSSEDLKRPDAMEVASSARDAEHFKQYEEIRKREPSVILFGSEEDERGEQLRKEIWNLASLCTTLHIDEVYAKELAKKLNEVLGDWESVNLLMSVNDLGMVKGKVEVIEKRAETHAKQSAKRNFVVRAVKHRGNNSIGDQVIITEFVAGAVKASSERSSGTRPTRNIGSAR